MAEKKNREEIFPDQGILKGLGTRIRLVVHLVRDPRISSFLKILPVGSLIYLLLPDFFLGPLDDALVLWVGSTLFVDLCPQVIVQEHLINIRSGMPGTLRGKPKNEVVIDAEFHDEK